MYVLKNASYLRQVVAVVGLWLTLGIVGCNRDENTVATTGQPATITGRVEGSNSSSTFGKTSAGIEGAVVTVAQVSSNGSLQVVSTASVETNANGEFSVQTNLDGTSNLEVVAEKSGTTWKAIVSAAVRSGATVYSRPLNIESTVEAEVYEEIVSSGNSSVVTSADVSLYVSAALAAEIYGDGNAIADVASSLVVSAQAQAATNSEIGASQAELSIMQSAEVNAEKQLETSLYLAGSVQVAVDAAYEAFAEAMVSVNSNTSVSAGEYAKVIEISGKALVNASADLASDVVLEIEKQAAVVKSYAVSVAIEAEFSALASSQATLNALATASATLRASISSAQDSAQIEAAFETYHDVVVNQLSATLTAYSSAITNVDATINANGGARADLSASVSSTTNSDALVSNYFSFFTAVESSVSSNLNSASSLQVTSTAEILMMANMIV